MKYFKDVTVLITAAGNVFMPGTTSCLKDNGERTIRLIGADMNSDDTINQMFDKYYCVPKAKDPSYVDKLIDICSKEDVDVLLPIMSDELLPLAYNLSRFEKINTKVSVSSIEGLTIANDKLKLFDYMKATGIPCANYFSVKNIEDFEQAVINLGYPHNKVCVKATNGSGSRGFRIIDENISRLNMFLQEKPESSYVTLYDMKSILSETDEFPELIVMEYLPGDEYTVDLLADKGKVIYCCCRKSLGMNNSIMLNSIVVKNDQISHLCNRIVESLKLDGNIGFDIKENYEGYPLIMECNPRITAGIPVFAKAGVNLPYLNVKRLLGETLPDCELQYGTVARRRWMEMYIL